MGITLRSSSIFVVALLTLALVTLRAYGQSGYLAKVGPAPVRLITPVRLVTPRVAVSSPTDAGAGVHPTEKPADPRDSHSESKSEGSEFLGPPPPPVQRSESGVSAATSLLGNETTLVPKGLSSTELFPDMAPVTPSAVALGDSTPIQAMTAQMLVRFFRPQPGLGVGTNLPPQLNSGTETSLWLPVPFVPPQPIAPLSSTSTYQVIPR